MDSLIEKKRIAILIDVLCPFAQREQSVFQKIVAFVEKFKGVGCEV
jgi:hypothetical protein